MLAEVSKWSDIIGDCKVKVVEVGAKFPSYYCYFQLAGPAGLQFAGGKEGNK